MKRQLTKIELFEEIDKERGNLDGLLNTLTEEEMSIAGVTEAGWAVKDVLTHLFEWEQLCLGWYNIYLQGEKPQLPAPGLKWNQLPELNNRFFEKHRSRPLSEILEEFQASHQQMLSAINSLSDEELISIGKYPWTGKWSLSNFIEASTASHYRWARVLIRKWQNKIKRNVN